MKKKLIWIFVIVLSVIYFYMLATVVKMQDSFSPQNSDCIIILGHSLTGTGNTGGASNWLVLRLEAGLSLYEKGLAPNIIVTGGKGQAAVMRNWLVSNGVPPGKIFVEGNSRNTYENFKFSSDIAYRHNFHSSIIVTNDFHIYRSMLIAGDYLDSISGYSADLKLSFRKILAYIKEPFSILKYELYNKRM